MEGDQHRVSDRPGDLFMTIAQPLDDSARAARLRRAWILIGVLVVVVVSATLLNRHFAGDNDVAQLKAGDCFQKTGSEDDPGVKQLGCGDSHARYRVLKRLDDEVTGLACSDVKGSTGSISAAGAESYVVCFARNRH